MSTLRERILSASDIQEEIVDVPEWGVQVLVRGMTGAQRAAYLEAAAPGGRANIANAYALLVITCALDPATRQPIFEMADRDALMAKSGRALERIAMAAMRLSGLTQAALAEAEKASAEASAGFTSSWPPASAAR